MTRAILATSLATAMTISGVFAANIKPNLESHIHGSCVDSCDWGHKICMKRGGGTEMCTNATKQCKRTGYYSIEGYANYKAGCKK